MAVSHKMQVSAEAIGKLSEHEATFSWSCDKGLKLVIRDKKGKQVFNRGLNKSFLSVIDDESASNSVTDSFSRIICDPKSDYFYFMSTATGHMYDVFLTGSKSDLVLFYKEVQEDIRREYEGNEKKAQSKRDSVLQEIGVAA